MSLEAEKIFFFRCVLSIFLRNFLAEALALPSKVMSWIFTRLFLAMLKTILTPFTRLGSFSSIAFILASR